MNMNMNMNMNNKNIKNKKNVKYSKNIGSLIYDIFIHINMLFVLAITLYPFIYTLSMSISKPIYAAQNSVYLFPKGLSLESYRIVMQNGEIWKAYYNTIWYTVVGTIINVLLTMISAYPLSRKTYFARDFLLKMVALTMFFGGGLIPSFILIRDLHLYNTRWAMILPGAISAWNLIIARTYLQTIPDSLHESAKIDGANDILILFKIILPLSMPVIAVLTLYYAVGHWNSYFNAMLYLPNNDLQPLQIYLRKVLILQSQQGVTDSNSSAVQISSAFDRSLAMVQLKYSVIIVTILPILTVYPFLQKYFVKGVMIGAIKG